ncbi:MAG TPA: BamA/TamA family outer membrane protein, partial [Gemmatimonadaceae bacterium]|nr:BamA/TamA family outer membrane protein [Gemmatimonadaceae bacterium]
MTADLSAIVVEYGLYGGRFWLPRSQSIEGAAQALLARVPIKLETSFSYASVNEPLGLTPIHVDTTAFHEQWRAMPPPNLDSAARKHWLDSARVAYNAAFKARRDSLDKGLKVGSMRQCDTAATRVETRYRSEAKIPVEMRVPCDLDKLLASSDLPPSIFDPGDDVFGSAEAERLAAAALGMGAQAPLSLGNLPAPRVQLGPSMTRYNRVEGFSTGALWDQQLGAGLSATAVGRFGFADKKPNFELSLARSDLTKTIRVNGYTRLVSANDWGSPLNFSSSLGALFFGRDEGFYYRATGAELLWTVERGPRLELRAFSEQQRNAPQNTTANLGATFIPNIESANVTSTGASLRYLGSFGQDIRGWRAFTDLRLEGAGGDSSYGRAALDVTLSKAITRRVDAALTLGGGTTTGHVPAQRRWFLGGTQTIRGQAADTAQSGTAFWMTRMELARSSEFMRTALFGDLGWAGQRERWGEFGRPWSGAGVGFSFLDGMIRFDAARGVYPRKDVRFAFYFNAPF